MELSLSAQWGSNNLIDKDGPKIITKAPFMGAGMKTGCVGSVMVVGGGISGMQAALDLADSGYYLYLVERSSSIGGVMSKVDKTFPTNDCAM